MVWHHVRRRARLDNSCCGFGNVGSSCGSGDSQAWSLPAGPIVTGARSLCLNNPSGSTVQVADCDGADSEAFALLTDGTIAGSSGQCLTASGSFAQNAVTLESCNDTDPFQLWEPGSSGEIVNLAFGLCLTDKNDGKQGSAVVQYDCYGNAGQNWGLN